MKYSNLIKRYRNLDFDSLIDDYKNAKDKDFFKFHGIQLYIGFQGSGKTISAVKHLIEIKKMYPKCIIVTNLKLNGIDAINFSTIEDLSTVLTSVNNDKLGVVYVIDEIHTYFNALDSKSIPPFIFAEISQQRKQRKLIIGTSQLFGRIAKPFREQTDTMIFCKTYAGLFTTNTAYDGKTLEIDSEGNLYGNVLARGWFYQTRKLRNFFDTYQKIQDFSSDYLKFEETSRVTKKNEGFPQPRSLQQRRRLW